jgi:hypothetical protein
MFLNHLGGRRPGTDDGGEDTSRDDDRAIPS